MAYWREVGARENAGNHSAYVHVWDENGQPLAGKQIYTSWGVLLGTTDPNGFVEIVLYRPNGYDFQVRDGAHTSETSPVLSVERAPSFGHYSFEIGFLLKQNGSDPGVFDTNCYGTLNSSGADLCLDLSAPCTASLAYYSTFPSNYCSDQMTLGNWTASHGQTFAATGNRVLAVKAMMAAGYNVHYYWTAQILEGGPGGTPVGPARSTRLMVDGEYFPILVKWGVNEVQVVPGRTYYLKITAAGGVNVWRINQDNYPSGNYFENGVSVPGAELMGLVLCAAYTNNGPLGQLSGFVRNAANQPVGGAVVSVPDAALYATTAADGSYTLPLVPAGTWDVSATKEGYTAGLNRGMIITAGQTTTCSFNLVPQTGIGGAIITNGQSYLQPFEVLPAWTTAFDASWGNAASFSIESSGQTGKALQVIRSGTGSSARVQVFPVKPNTAYAVSVWIRCPSSGSPYWAECACKPGNFSAQDFDGNSSTWRMIQKFSDTGVNGNGNTWRQYTLNLNSGNNTRLSVGFKLGASSGTGPTLRWDELAIVSLALPGLVAAVADSPSMLTVQFAEPVSETSATNLGNYSLAGPGGPLSLYGATLLHGTNLVITTEPQIRRIDYTLSASNVVNFLQPVNLAGLNGMLPVRVPTTLVAIDDITNWRYEQSGADLATAWRERTFDDSGWLTGRALLAQSTASLPEPIRTPLSTAAGKLTYYFRTQFELPAGLTNALLRLRPIVADGAVFWLNGLELLRLGITNNPVLFSTPAARAALLPAYEGPFDVEASGLSAATNVLAVEVHKQDPAGSRVVFGTSVEALILPSQLPQPVLVWSRRTNGMRLTWSGPAFLETSTNAAGPWHPAPGIASPSTFPVSNNAAFFRLRE